MNISRYIGRDDSSLLGMLMSSEHPEGVLRRGAIGIQDGSTFSRQLLFNQD